MATKNALENYVHYVRSILRRGKSIGINDKRKLEVAIDPIMQWLDWNYLSFDAFKFEQKMKELKDFVNLLFRR